MPCTSKPGTTLAPAARARSPAVGGDVSGDGLAGLGDGVGGADDDAVAADGGVAGDCGSAAAVGAGSVAKARLVDATSAKNTNVARPRTGRGSITAARER